MEPGSALQMQTQMLLSSSATTPSVQLNTFLLFFFFSKAGQLVNEGNMTVEDFLESNHQLRVQQQTAREEEEDRADDMEAEELNNLRQVLY